MANSDRSPLPEHGAGLSDADEWELSSAAPHLYLEDALAFARRHCQPDKRPEIDLAIAYVKRLESRAEHGAGERVSKFDGARIEAAVVLSPERVREFRQEALAHLHDGQGFRESAGRMAALCDSHLALSGRGCDERAQLRLAAAPPPGPKE